jgi:hypothetical protein
MNRCTARYAGRRGDKCVVVVTVASARSSMFAIVSFEGVLNFTAEGRLYYRIGAHLHRYKYTLLDVDGTLPRSMSTPSRDRLRGNPVDDFDD